MAIQPTDIEDGLRERELTRHLRGLVETSFEEGQCDSALALLNRLRHAANKPYPPHIRHVLYLALLPPPSPDAPGNSGARLDIIPSSPSKFAAKQRSQFTASVAIIEDAQSLLRAIAQTNTPQSICRALPSFGLTGIENLPDIHVIADNDDDIGEFELARLSKRIQDVKSCWEILKEGFIHRDSMEPVQKKKGRKSVRQAAGEDSFDAHSFSTDPPLPVSESAWPVLEFLLAVFEKDEIEMSSKHDLRFSPHLLAQIPASRTSTGARWDAAAALDIVFYCLRIPGRSSLGVRLLALLINLTTTIHLDLAMLLNAVNNRLLSLPAEDLQSIFTLLPSSPACLRFQIALCRLSLTESQSSGGSKQKPRPQARSAPRALTSHANDTSSNDVLSSTAKDASGSTLARKFAGIPTAEILQIFSTPSTASPSDPLALGRKLQLKFFMITALGELQEQLLPAERDPDWTKTVESGELAKSASTAFTVPASAQETDLAMAADLKTMLALASARWCRWCSA